MEIEEEMVGVGSLRVEVELEDEYTEQEMAAMEDAVRGHVSDLKGEIRMVAER